MENKNKKSNTILFISLIVISIVVILGVTFAYFTAIVAGNDDASSVNVQTGYLAIDFETSEYIDNFRGELISDDNRATDADFSRFTVRHKSNSTHAATYILSLTDIEISNNLKSADFKWELLKNNETINSGNFYSIGNQTKITITPEAQILDVSDVDSYIFRIWLSETSEDQSSLYSGTFQGKIELEAQTTQS